MVSKSGLEGKKSNILTETRNKKTTTSKVAVKTPDVAVTTKKPKSSSASDPPPRPPRTVRIRSKTVERSGPIDKNKPRTVSPSKTKEKEKCDKVKSETSLLPKKPKENEETSQKSYQVTPLSKIPGPPIEVQDSQKKTIKKPSEIPKLKSITKGMPSKFRSKSPPKPSWEEPEAKESEPGPSRTTSLSPKPAPRVKKDDPVTENIKKAMEDEFTSLVPLYETELKRITDVWVNTIYCSLTMRTNLVKLLFQAFPHVDKSQFQMEDEKLLHCISHAKSYTKFEADQLIQFIGSLIANREKAKEQIGCLLTNREIAEVYNYDWRKLNRKIAEMGEETKKLQSATPELLKNKQEIDLAQKEKIRELELDLVNKDEEIQKLANQLQLLKQKESTYKGNVLLEVKDYKDIKADVLSLKSTEKEFEELKAKFEYQNEMNEKKIKELELLLEEKKKTLQKEKEVKKQLQTFWGQMQAQQQLTTSIGKDQVEYVMGRAQNNKDKRREQLWVAAVKLVLKGFLMQMNKLERDKDKMLLELQSNDLENLNAMAANIFRKDNFIKSIKYQMNNYKKAFKYMKESNVENQ